MCLLNNFQKSEHTCEIYRQAAATTGKTITIVDTAFNIYGNIVKGCQALWGEDIDHSDFWAEVRRLESQNQEYEGNHDDSTS